MPMLMLKYTTCREIAGIYMSEGSTDNIELHVTIVDTLYICSRRHKNGYIGKDYLDRF